MIASKDIVQSLSNDRSKAKIQNLVELIDKEGPDFIEFFAEVDRQKHPVKWHMTWLLTHFIEKYPEVGQSIQLSIWKLLKATSNQSMLRDLWCCISHIEINDEISGEVYAFATGTFTSQKHAIAVRAHSLECACKIAQPYQELRDEMALFLKPLKIMTALVCDLSPKIGFALFQTKVPLRQSRKRI